MSYNTLRALLITSLIVNTLLIGYIIGERHPNSDPSGHHQ